jgi:hypothetical protein
MATVRTIVTVPVTLPVAASGTSEVPTFEEIVVVTVPFAKLRFRALAGDHTRSDITVA